MTMAEQIFEVLGRRVAPLGRGLAPSGFTDGTRRRITRAGRSVRRQSEEFLQPIPAPVLWLGAAIIAAAAASLFWRGTLVVRARRVADVMVRDVFTIDASTTLAEAAQMMRDGNVGVLPVVDRGRLHGVITDRDLVVRAMARNMDAASTPVRYIASEDLACARPEWDVEDAMRVMADCRVGRLPVVDDDDRVVGIVTLSTLALRSREERDALHAAQEVSRRSARMAS